MSCSCRARITPEAAEIAERFPVPEWFVQNILDALGGDADMTQRWLAACSLTGRYIDVASLKILKLSVLGEVR